MSAKNKKRPPARLELIWSTLTQVAEGTSARRKATHSLAVAEADSFVDVGASTYRRLMSVEFNLAVDDPKSGSAGRASDPGEIAARTSGAECKRGRATSATAIKLTVSYEPCTVDVIVCTNATERDGRSADLQ